jgi:hypothetical protein
VLDVGNDRSIADTVHDMAATVEVTQAQGHTNVKDIEELKAINQAQSVMIKQLLAVAHHLYATTPALAPGLANVKTLGDFHDASCLLFGAGFGMEACLEVIEGRGYDRGVALEVGGPDAGRVVHLEEVDGDALKEFSAEPGDGTILNPEVGAFVDSLDAVCCTPDHGQ